MFPCPHYIMFFMPCQVRLVKYIHIYFIFSKNRSPQKHHRVANPPADAKKAVPRKEELLFCLCEICRIISFSQSAALHPSWLP